MIYVGTCGFSYKDWIGRFYPAKIKPAEMLPYYARLFRAVEIDSSYYGVPSPRTVESMAARTPANFRFSFKMPQTVTHAPDPAARLHDDASAFRASLEPMRSAGKLACALAQFPNAFKPGAASGDHVKRIAEAFEAIPLVFEFRNRLWQQPATTAMLRELGVGYCNADMPALEGLLEPSADVTSSVGYVRFHGRNARQWWRGSNVTRYEYAYSPEELVPWTGRIAEIDAAGCRDVRLLQQSRRRSRGARRGDVRLAPDATLRRARRRRARDRGGRRPRAGGASRIRLVRAVVTAGGRVDGEYARLAGTTVKALAMVRGVSMLDRILDALRGAGATHIAVVGGAEVRAACARPRRARRR